MCTPRPNQSRSAPAPLRGRHADLEAVAHVAVVGRLAFDDERDAFDIGQSRQHVGDEAHAVEAARGDGAGVRGRPLASTSPSGPEAASARARRRRATTRSARGLRKSSLPAERTAACDASSRRSRRRTPSRCRRRGRRRSRTRRHSVGADDDRWRERPVGGHHRGDTLQTRAQLLAEARHFLARHLDDLVLQHHALQLGTRRWVEMHQAQPRVLDCRRPSSVHTRPWPVFPMKVTGVDVVFEAHVERRGDDQPAAFAAPCALGR